MKRLYLFTLEIVPLEIGKTYDDLPSHLTLMSRFSSDLSPREITDLVRPLFESTDATKLDFGATVRLGPKQVTVHMVKSAHEQELHEDLYALLKTAGVRFQYPEFIGVSHKAHVTKRENVDFPPGSQLVTSATYLIEVVEGKRVVRSKLKVG